MFSSLYAVPTWILCLVFAAFLGASVELGFRAGRRRHERADGAVSGIGPLEAAVFGLFGLLLALTFSYVVSRADARRELLVLESNAIGTAYLRCDVAPDPQREELRAKIRAYVDQRIAQAEAGTDEVRATEASRRAIALQGEIWSGAARLARERPDAEAYAILLEALNEMFDLQTSREAIMRAHLPSVVLAFLAATALAAAIVAGYALGLSGQMHRVAVVSFVVLTTMVAFIILDLDRPRRGVFRAPIGALRDLRDTIRGDVP
jgi:hypothetical protein